MEGWCEGGRVAWSVDGNVWTRVSETVAREAPVRVLSDGRLVGVLACTPCDLEDLAAGFLFSTGAIASVRDIGSIDVEDAEGGIVVEVLSSCGVPEVERREPRIQGGKPLPFPLAVDAIHRASAALLDAQVMHRATGATHAAAFVDADGSFRFVREDIGRHNAVDKLIGALLRNGADPRQGFVHLSSRCALELVEKLANAGVRLVSTISAPTSAVLEYADVRGIALCAFARNGRFTVYTHPELLAR